MSINTSWISFINARFIKLASVTLALLLLLLPPALPAAGQSTPVEARALNVAVDATGQPWAVWEVDDGQDTDVYYSLWSGQAWQAPHPLSADPGTWESSPTLAFSPEGTAWAAWSASTGPDRSSIYVSRWLGRSWSEPVLVPGTDLMGARQPALGAAGDGSLWLAWIGEDGTDREVFASYRDGRAWSAPQQVGKDDADPQAYDTHPRVAVGLDGQAWLVWSSHEGPLNTEIHASHWDGTAWSSQEQINAGDDLPDSWPSLALDSEGQPWVAWHGAEIDAGERSRISFSRWDAAKSAWSPESLVSSPTRLAVHEEQASLAFDANGHPHLAWTVSGRLSGIAYSTWDAAGWTTPTWTPTDLPVEARAAASGKAAHLVWLAADSVPSALAPPLPVETLKEHLPDSLPTRPARSLEASTYIPNRHLAHGDSITKGAYEDVGGGMVTPYPVFLEQRLDSNAGPSEVINGGKDAEKVRAAEERLRDNMGIYQPQYVLILEGTNDVSMNKDAADTAHHLRLLIWAAREEAGDAGVEVVIATLTPRLDHKNGDIALTNQEYLKVANRERVPVADQWSAFYNYGPFEEFYTDFLHPGTTGLNIIADTFFQTMVNAGMIPQDSMPPTAQITTLPPQSECSAVVVGWAGDDGAGSGIGSFDVQVRDNGGPWMDWLVETPNSSGTYVGATYDHTLGFRVRARDKVGNLGSYSSEKTTQIVDNTKPDLAGVTSLPAYQIPPFAVAWWGHDLCSPIASFDVEYRVGSGAWERWLTGTTESSAVFDPESPQCGQTYFFRARAYDLAGKGSEWSAGTASTTLVCHAVSGFVLTVRETPIFHAGLSTSPQALAPASSDAAGAYSLYFGGAANYDVTVARDGFGSLPAQEGLAVTGHLMGVDFYLPPLDDQVDNGGFENGWGNWQRGGASLPAKIATAHTGTGAVLLDPGSVDSRLSQSLTLPVGMTEPTLSLVFRLADGGGPNSTLAIRLEGSKTETFSLPVSSSDWGHHWVDLSGFVGQTVDLVLTVSDDPGVIVDEVSLGSAVPGVYPISLPQISRNHG